MNRERSAAVGRPELPVLTGPAHGPGPGASSPGTTPDIEALRAALAASVAGEVRFDRTSRALYATDASVYQIVPAGVVLPRTAADVLATLGACARSGVPLTARGGGTSQAGQAIGPGVILDTSKHFRRIIEVNARDLWARVEPGCVLDDLNRVLKPLGLLFAPDVSTSNRATIGGMIANNSSGARSVWYGKTVDHVLELTVALADGTVLRCQPLDPPAFEARCARQDREGECYRTVRRLAAELADEIERRYPKILRRVGGYNLDRFRPAPAPTAGPRPMVNLADLFVGSEGTLGVTLEAKLRLVELPAARAVLVVQFAELLDALAATPAILAHRPAAVEVIDRYVLDSTRLNPEAARLRDFLAGDPGAILIVELYDAHDGSLPRRLDALEADLRQRRFGDRFHRATDPAAQARIWALRKMALGLSMAEKGDAKAISFVEDTAVAPEHLRDYIAELLQLVARHGTRAGVYAHASVGCLHVRPVIDLKTEAGVRRFEAIASETADLVLKYGGALSGEHGDGLVRSPFQERMYGPALYRAFRELKRAFDPQGLLNPGKIVDAPPLSANLRYGPGYVTPAVPTTFDFSADGGLVQAAELCSGVGACRKTREGGMCPSYQATREEQHTTRGRANALRLATTGQLGFRGLTDPALFEVLDLCLECKACKAECPTNVDMARLKAEFLHQYYRERGLPRRNRLFGQLARWARLGCATAPLSNAIAQSRLARRLGERWLGINSRRVPPRFARRPFFDEIMDSVAWGALSRGSARSLSGDAPLGSASERQVLLFPDTFVNYFEPEVGLAALDLLGKVGVKVALDPTDRPWRKRSQLRCCGRPMISNGMLDEAVACARHNLERLEPWASRGLPIVACEPSCLLTIRDDYPALVRGELRRRAEVVAAACQTFEEFLEGTLARAESGGEGGAGSPPLTFRAGPRRLLVQGHCHQRALVGLGPLLRLLRRIPKAEVVDLDAGCCGMAGSFGYEVEHYELSRQIGELRLFPPLRVAEPYPETIIVAPGFSCRLQIAHFTGRAAWHPAEVLRSLIEDVRPPAEADDSPAERG